MRNSKLHADYVPVTSQGQVVIAFFALALTGRVTRAPHGPAFGRQV